MSDITIYTPSDRSVLEPMLAAQRRTYLNSDEDWQSWLDWVPLDQVRMAKRGDKVIGGMMLVPGGQFFGGRSVSMTGLAGVGIEPAERASGAGAIVMRLVLEEMHRNGVAVSTLWPATMNVYRRVGYEFAGHNHRYVINTDHIDVRDRTLRIELTEDLDALKAVYAEHVRRSNGSLDRTDFFWGWRVTSAWKQEVDTYLVHGDDGPEGYIAYYRTSGGEEGNRFKMHASWVGLTAAAVRRILTFLVDHRSFIGEVHWTGAPDDGFSMHLSEPRRMVHMAPAWMTRIVDVERALTQRGYSSAVSAELHLNVRDDLFSHNDGDYIVRVSDGRAEVERGGRGSVSVDVRGLAPLFTGYRSAHELLSSGYISGSDDELAAADAVFAGPAPWMPDAY